MTVSIEEYNKIKKEKEEFETRVNFLVNSNPTPILMTDFDKNVVLVNKHWLELLNLSKADVTTVDSIWISVAPHVKSLDGVIKAAIRTREKEEASYCDIEFNDGRRRTIYFAPIIGPDGEFIGILCQILPNGSFVEQYKFRGYAD
jgi:PAS domain-containing protein